MSRPASIGVVAGSAKENERRLPIHPAHLGKVPEELRPRVFLEHGYGESFGRSDESLAGLVGGFRTRDELLHECATVLLPKPQLEDVQALSPGQVLWGWPHCVQDRELTQAAIDARLTLIAFETMNHWRDDGSLGLHVFHRNNELAGYASVMHALQLAGVTGAYGRRLRAVVIGFGATARGAVTALNALGVHDVDVLTHREVPAVASPIHSARIIRFDHDASEPHVGHAYPEGLDVPLAGFLAEHDVIVNCVLQDTEAPMILMEDEDLAAMTPGTVVVDVSCDEGMGFSWARPTSFDDPTFEVGDHVLYYAVDHSPSYLWNSATWENSLALLPYLPTVLGGGDAWDANETIRRAIEIREGHVVNPRILSFQHREATFPHAPLTAGAEVPA